MHTHLGKEGTVIRVASTGASDRFPRRACPCFRAPELQGVPQACELRDQSRAWRRFLTPRYRLWREVALGSYLMRFRCIIILACCRALQDQWKTYAVPHRHKDRKLLPLIKLSQTCSAQYRRQVFSLPHELVF
ncbi:hypothetical protein MUK42_33297 [Musa troglodytarum]|uniref:Uncharacterized protein n=1 Tax=Musa troglodytarum TaxID=320322 RepID=A0A9E7FC69_9LILI|nr:hypothetical protein MUK42_33297 [Musa troglodytarum]